MVSNYYHLITVIVKSVLQPAPPSLRNATTHRLRPPLRYFHRYRAGRRGDDFRLRGIPAIRLHSAFGEIGDAARRPGRDNMALKSLVPEGFGPLRGLRIISSGVFIAQPFAAELAAEMGAEAIQIEQPGIGDIGWRGFGNKLPGRDGGPAGRNELDSGAAQSLERHARSLQTPRPRAVSGPARNRRNLDGKLAARHVQGMEPRRRHRSEGQSRSWSSPTSPDTDRTAIPTTSAAPPSTRLARASAALCI